MLKDTKQNLFREERLVWMSPPEGPSTEPVVPDTKVDSGEKAPEAKEITFTADNIDEVAKRVKDLNFKNAVEIKTLPGQAPVLQFKAALSKALEGYTPKLNVTNLDQFLLNGLMEQLGAADTEISKMKPNENQALSKFLQGHKVAKFTIEDGFWRFIDKNGKTVTADYQLDGVGTHAERAVLGSAVQKAKEDDVKAATDKAAADKAEAEREKPETLEKVNSVLSVPLDQAPTLDKLVEALVITVTPDRSQPPILADEMKQSLTSYIEGYTLGDPEKNFAAFLRDLKTDGYIDCRIVKGRIAFSKDGKRYTANPLDRSHRGVKTELYAHPEMGKTRLEEAQKKAKEQADDAKDKKTPFDDAESQAVKIITGKETPDERDKNNANIDARYLPAIKSILDYRLNGAPVAVNISFNDIEPLKCQFAQGPDGSYAVTWAKGVGFHRFMPTVKGEAGLREAQRYFVANLNNGRIFQEVQKLNVKNKESFAKWGQVVDDGPKNKDGGVFYELDWDKGRDPRLIIYTEPHGALRVVVKKSGIGLNGENTYEFRSGNLKDMMRTLKRLQNWVESDDINKGKMKAGEEDLRFFEKVIDGARDLKGEALRVGAGKLLNVSSVNNMSRKGEFSSGFFDRGHYLDFDWMQKLVPPQRLQMFRNGTGSFEYYLMPTRQKLGESPSAKKLNGVSVLFPASEAMSNALAMVSQQRQLMMTKGGEKQREGGFQDVLKAANQELLKPPKENEEPKDRNPFVLRQGVTVEGASTLGTVQLRLPGATVAQTFNLGTKDKPNMAGFIRAEQTGCLVRTPAEVSRPEAGEAVEAKEAPRPSDRISVTLDSSHELRERTSYSDQRREAINEVCDALKGSDKKPTPHSARVMAYAALRLAAFEPGPNMETVAVKHQFKNEIWRILSDLSGVNGAYLTDESVRTQIINNLKGRDAVEKMDKASAISGQPLLEELHQTRMYLKGMFDSFDRDIWLDMEVDENVKLKAKEQYRSDVLTEMTKIINGNSKTRSEKSVVYDRRIYHLARMRVRIPREYLADYLKNEEIRKTYDQNRAEQTAKEEAKNNYEQIRTEPHLMSLDELELKPVAGMVEEGLRLFKSVKSVQRTDVFFSRMKGNDFMGRNDACFNVLAANPNQPGEKMWMTVHIFRERGELRVGASDGFNNVSRGENRDWVGAGDTAIDQALDKGWARHQGLNTDTMVVPTAVTPSPTPPAEPVAAATPPASPLPQPAPAVSAPANPPATPPAPPSK